MEPADTTDELARLAARHGVATSYRNWRQEPVHVSPDTVRAVLAAMGVLGGLGPAAATDDASSSSAVRAALERAERRSWLSALPPTVVARRETPKAVTLRAPTGTSSRVRVELADGSARDLAPAEEPLARCDLEGTAMEARSLELPLELPIGAHTLTVETSTGEQHATLYVVPSRVRTIDRLSRTWGWMVQLYALRSRDSWGVGDLGSLRRLLTSSAPAHGADFVLVNPLHAVAPTTPRQASPYYPTSRRFFDPMTLEIEALPELGLLDDDGRRQVEQLAAPLRAANTEDRIDRDRAFGARQAALELLFAVEVGQGRRAEFAAYREAGGAALEGFATWSVLAEQHGVPWQQWPASLQDPHSPVVAQLRQRQAQRIRFHAWLQWCCDQQLAAVQQAARNAGAAIGVVHDLAVGVDPGGADAWALQDDLAAQASIGAPPDEFNRQGQDWGLPPLLPERLADTGYRAFREIVGATLRHAGGLRIDHALGLFRLYWIPEGAGAAEGTYVNYPAEDLLGILAMEADAADAVVVAEDLGTVPEGTSEALRSHGFLGSEVLYFARDEKDRGLRAQDYEPLTFASVTTHDLPTAAGWWTDEAPRLQDHLGMLGQGRTLEEVLSESSGQQQAMRGLLREAGVLPTGAEHDLHELVLAMYRFLARTPALLVAAWLPDAVGDLRQPNLPGTLDEYPNWRLPIAEPRAGEGGARPVLLESLQDDARVHRLVEALRRG